MAEQFGVCSMCRKQILLSQRYFSLLGIHV